MNLKQWQINGWLKPHKTSRQEIGKLLAIARRDLADACQDALSEDWQFGIAYNAALKLCTILLYAEGYRPAHDLAHYRTLQALPVILSLDARRMRSIWIDAAPSATRSSMTMSAEQPEPTRTNL